MSPQAIAHQLDNMPVLPGRIVIDVAENQMLSDLMPLLVTLCEKGFGWYSIRVGGTSLNFHVPGCGMEEHFEEPNVVDLREDPSEAFESGGASRPILVLVDDSMNCKKMLDRLRNNGLIHESIEIHGDDLEFLRSPQEDLPRKNYHNPRLPPTFLQRLLEGIRKARTTL
jgi:hypothetical protein